MTNRPSFLRPGRARAADQGRLAARYRSDVARDRLDEFARSLGLSPASLRALGVGWSAAHGAFSFPMYDADSRVIGIGLRGADGRRGAVHVGQDGLFLPAGTAPSEERLLICTGPTDAAALLDLGYRHVVGRPSRTAGWTPLCGLVRRRQPVEAVIIAGPEEPGRRGADNLPGVLVAYGLVVRVIVPPNGRNDVRDFLTAGGTTEELEAAFAAAAVRSLPNAAGRTGQ
jgi:hypothetical protein